MDYLHWDEKTITDFSDSHISEMYEKGYVFTRKGKGVMQQTRSVRIDLSKFNLSSENRRILKKVPGIAIGSSDLPLPVYGVEIGNVGEDFYRFEMGKMGKDFYEEKFGPDVMSAYKIKEMITDPGKSNFNVMFSFSMGLKPHGYTICYRNVSLLHYSYPFYDLKISPKDMGLGMMIAAICFAKDNGIKYFYLGSLQRPSDTYKLQFEGLEWFDGTKWQTDLESVKKILASAKMSE